MRLKKTLKLKDVRDFNESELKKFAGELGSNSEPGWCILLEGPLGAGKSTFSRAFFEGAGVTQAAEGSPTFPIAHMYQKKSQPGFYIHADLYRLESMDELEATGLLEFFWDPQNISLIEWPSQIEGFAENMLERHPDVVLIRFGIDESKPLSRSLQAQ